jgi:hypothetical protein
MTSTKTVRDALATRLKTIGGLNVPDTVPGTITTPSAVITLESLTYDSTMSRGSDDLTFAVTVFASTANDRAGETALYSFIDGTGANSIKAAIEADPVLGGVVMYAVVAGASEIGIREYGGTEYYSAQFAIAVSVSG